MAATLAGLDGAPFRLFPIAQSEQPVRQLESLPIRSRVNDQGRRKHPRGNRKGPTFEALHHDAVQLKDPARNKKAPEERQ